MSKEDLTDYAARLSLLGYVCVPLVKGGKHLDLSAMGLEPVHLRSRRKDLKELAFTGTTFWLAQCPPATATIRSWFEGHDGNIGILTGLAGLVVLDFDKLPVFERWRRRNAGLCSATPVGRTPNGIHIYLRCPTPRASSSLHLGIRRAGHIKALGGYVVASPSILCDGAEYGWLPGQSPFDVEPQNVDSIEALALRPVSPLKLHYDRLLGRGSFQPR